MKNDANNIVIAFEDMLKVKCNVDINDNFEDTQTPFVVKTEYKETCTVDSNTIDVYTVAQEWELGFAIYINGSIEYLIVIYEPHGAKINKDLNAIITYGHEQIITLNLANGVFDETYTR